MIKKITLVLVLLCFIVSCGKKGDPKYTSSQKNILITSIPVKIT